MLPTRRERRTPHLAPKSTPGRLRASAASRPVPCESGTVRRFHAHVLARTAEKTATLGIAALQGARIQPHGETKIMATSKKPAAGKKSAPKPITEVLSKSSLVSYLSEHSGVEMKGVRAVLAALEQAVSSSVHKKGAGQFTLPGLLKITATAVAAKPKRKGVDPFTKEERWFAAKPASVKVKVRPLKKLKDAAL
jgi:hypothetical protein